MKTLMTIRRFTVKISNCPAFLDFRDHIKKVFFLFGFFISKLKIRWNLLKSSRNFSRLSSLSLHIKNVINKSFPKLRFYILRLSKFRFGFIIEMQAYGGVNFVPIPVIDIFL